MTAIIGSRIKSEESVVHQIRTAVGSVVEWQANISLPLYIRLMPKRNVRARAPRILLGVSHGPTSIA
ncbi:hypothetical protein [Bradyrhizobium jicamae]|uniref:hypothetical protein n=1 Tax=Bradyrhizobium jicamae TaxID=280332 RepID=UPI001BA5F695|nr:hypothetical protein [Bradyrhizobium jicamae]MBR0939483.1 hypothetical protein [Bradyrhizobium jicamae]